MKNVRTEEGENAALLPGSTTRVHRQLARARIGRMTSAQSVRWPRTRAHCGLFRLSQTRAHRWTAHERCSAKVSSRERLPHLQRRDLPRIHRARDLEPTRALRARPCAASALFLLPQEIRTHRPSGVHPAEASPSPPHTGSTPQTPREHHKRRASTHSPPARLPPHLTPRLIPPASGERAGNGVSTSATQTTLPPSRTPSAISTSVFASLRECAAGPAPAQTVPAILDRPAHRERAPPRPQAPPAPAPRSMSPYLHVVSTSPAPPR
ncbi:hypothetical protein DFH06DRAFT_1341746 [Mycena polygramma]|nr:hypothetical protein DFH06DRAFT_1341746 [Mycena polygramma]